MTGVQTCALPISLFSSCCPSWLAEVTSLLPLSTKAGEVDAGAPAISVIAPSLEDSLEKDFLAELLKRTGIMRAIASMAATAADQAGRREKSGRETLRVICSCSWRTLAIMAAKPSDEGCAWDNSSRKSSVAFFAEAMLANASRQAEHYASLKWV